MQEYEQRCKKKDKVVVGMMVDKEGKIKKKRMGRKQDERCKGKK